MGTILLIGGIALLAVLGVEYGLYRRAKRRRQEGTFDQGLPFIAHGHHPGDDIPVDHRATEHHAHGNAHGNPHGPIDHPGD